LELEDVPPPKQFSHFLLIFHLLPGSQILFHIRTGWAVVRLGPAHPTRTMNLALREPPILSSGPAQQITVSISQKDMDLPIDDALPLNAPERSASFHQERLPDNSAACKGQGVSPLQAAYLRRSGGELYIQHLTIALFILIIFYPLFCSLCSIHQNNLNRPLLHLLWV
jgi:hypothetical protein